MGISHNATWLKRAYDATGGVPRSISKLSEFLLPLQPADRNQTAIATWVKKQAQNYVAGDKKHFLSLETSAKKQLLQLFSPKGLDFGDLRGACNILKSSNYSLFSTTRRFIRYWLVLWRKL